MRKIIVALAVVMIATPGWAAIAITATDLGGGVVGIDYSGTELARAYALDIVVTAGTITAIGDYKVGDDNNGYGIFPANFSRYITVLANGQVEKWDVNNYTPVAPADSPGALGGLGTAGITIEMASLYVTKAPPLKGRLCTITCSESCRLTITTNATRGNVVLENATQATVDLAGATNVPVTIGTVLAFTGAHPEEWEAVGKPDCWIASLNPRQCLGDADGASQGRQNFWVSTNDLDILIAAWNKPFELLTGNQICADFNHLSQGREKFRVSTNDLDILIASWNIADGPAGNCP